MRREILKLAKLLDKYRIKYLIFGGLASTKYGTPRATFDIDVVVKKENIPENFIEGNEVDFWMDVDGFNFDDDSWKHRSDEEIDGVCVHFMSAEDLLVSKLSIIIQTESNHIDIISILMHQAKNLDVDYFSKRINQFKLEDKLCDLRQRIIELSEDPEITDLGDVVMVLNKICRE
ncbi:MAG: hypothetical protein A7315_13430 [Candidatus Altiarchaeales archaeon WOR_SM1_79]|nr:MAG: hypothetical protein A7315_13430 [Candidatus Altiarchaeales archaeon WOR_SM1_79]